MANLKRRYLVPLAVAAVGFGACGGGGGAAKPDGGGGVAGGNSGSGGAGGGAGGLAMLREPKYGPIDVDPVACLAAADAGAITFDKIAIWRDDAKGAYSMIHDDMCGPALRGIDQYAVPALAKRKLTAGVGPFVEVCEDFGLWNVVTEAEAKGNEIINHSYTHPNITAANAAMEVTMAKAVFDGKIKNPVSFFIFPFDFWTADTLAAVGAAGHIGARAGDRDDNDGFMNPPLNLAEPGKDMELEFDVWPRAYSKYALYRPEFILDLHAHLAIESGKYAVREMHSISASANPQQDGSEGFGPVPLRLYEDHLDFLVQAWKKNLVWIGNPSTVIRYRQARVACKASVAGNAISFDTADPNCTKFATPLSVIVKTTNDVPGLKATQMDKLVFTRKIAAMTFSVTANPTLGNVMLEGCSTPSSTVDTALPMPVKPMPAASVCDIEKVAGTGTPGNMDNLDRPATQLQLLPNPAQKDGRTGSWSWYPGNVMVDVVREPPTSTNGVLRYAGGNLGAWTGVTLAFLGGNGAGACYDATKYKGIRFKIKGKVTSPDLLNGAIILSVVTAETQTQKYGGDRVMEGGHFNKPILLTPDWTMVSLMWTDLMTPTWGPAPLPTALALTKLQALDWGISNMATDFEIFLDDIELF